MLRAGRLNKRVLIQTKTSTENSFGEEVVTWVDVDTVWAGIEPLSSKEFVESDQQNFELITRIVIRYRSNMDPFIRFIWESRTLYPSGQPIDKNGRHIQLEYLCYERI